MSTVTVRISKQSRENLRRMAARDDVPMQAILESALHEYETRRFLEAANRSYAALRKNPKSWKAELKEREAWDATLGDGLETD